MKRRIRRAVHVVFAVAGFCLIATKLLAADPTVTVDAGAVDRPAGVVTFTRSGVLANGEYWELFDGAGQSTVMQPGLNATGYFEMDGLPVGQRRVFTARPIRQPEAAVEAINNARAVEVRLKEKPFFVYNGWSTALPEGFEPQYQRGCYIHPLRTPSGRVVTDDYPPNHKHHHGVWSAWTKTEVNGRHPDFWNMGEKTGAVEFAYLPIGSFSGPLAALVATEHDFVDLSPKAQAKTALKERWLITAYAPAIDQRYQVFDLLILQSIVSTSPLILPKYLYGGLGFRGNRTWDGKDGCTFLTSEGKDRSKGNETRGRWCYIGGKVDGEMAGVAILCHPSNFRFPQPMRLHPTEPFFCFAPSQLGDWAIEAGVPYVARYRFVTMDGEPNAELIERLWKDYAEPPSVVVQ